MTIRQRSRAILGCIALAVLAAPLGCGGGSQGGPPGAVGAAGSSSTCDAKRSEVAACSSPAEAKSFEVTGASTKQEETAIGRINDQIKELSGEQSRLCKEYAACSIDDGTFQRGTASVKQRMDNLPGLIDAMKSAKSPGQRKRALDGLYRGVVPEEKRVEELTFRMGMTAVLPESGGGKTIDVEPGATLPTNTRAAFAFEVSRDAYLYIFQKSPKGEVNVLFPDARIGTKNPLRAGVSVQIPSNGQRFRLNDQDLGTENVYLVASRDPITSLDASLQRVKEGKVTQISQDSMLRSFTQVAPGTPPADCKTRAFELEPSAADAPADGPTCSRTRGLVLDPDDAPAKGGAAAAAAPSAGTPTSFTGRAVMEVRTDPGDSVIVKVFPFKHVSEADFTAQKAAPAAAAAAGVKTRSVVIEF